MTTTEQLQADSTTKVTPDPILRLASGFMAAKHLFAASELGMFEALADAPAPLDALAARTGLTPRAARISADAVAALGILERDADVYRNSPTADRFLAGKAPSDLRPLLRLWDRISYPAWVDFAEALARGPVREVFDLDEEEQAIASAGIEAVLAGPANALGQVVDFRRPGGCSTWVAAPAPGPSRRHDGTRTCEARWWSYRRWRLSPSSASPPPAWLTASR